MPSNIVYENLRPRKAFWGERKKERSLGMTDAAWEGLDQVAKELGLSRSEVVQQIGLRLLTVVAPASPKCAVAPEPAVPSGLASAVLAGTPPQLAGDGSAMLVE
jgi:hypothetical protein